MSTRPGAPRRSAGTVVRVVVAGPPGTGKTTFIRTISEITVLSTERDGGPAEGDGSDVAPALDVGRIKIDHELVLSLLGTPDHARFDATGEILGDGVLGFVLLVDATRAASYDAAADTLGAFRKIAELPFVVAVNRVDAAHPLDEEGIRGPLDLDASVPVVACDAADRGSVKAVLLTLLEAVVAEMDRGAG